MGRVASFALAWLERQGIHKEHLIRIETLEELMGTLKESGEVKRNSPKGYYRLRAILRDYGYDVERSHRQMNPRSTHYKRRKPAQKRDSLPMDEPTRRPYMTHVLEMLL